MSRISAIARIIRYAASAIITAAGILGIVAFSLAPVLATYPIYAVWPQLKAIVVGAPSRAPITYHHHQTLEFDYVCGQNSTSNATIIMHCSAETTADSEELSAISCDVGPMTVTRFLLLQVR